MANPLRRFNSRLADRKFEDGGGNPKGMPALFGSMNARDDYIKRESLDAEYVDPDKSAQRKVGTWIQFESYGKIQASEVSSQQDLVDYRDAAYLTMKKAFDDEGLGDYFVDAFPYKLAIWYDNRNFGAFDTTPAFPTHATVFTHSSSPTDPGNDAVVVSHINSVRGSTPVLALRGIASDGISATAIDTTFPHRTYFPFGVSFTNPDVNTDGANTYYDMPYGRTASGLEITVDFKLSEPEGVALKAYFDALNPTANTFGDSLVALAFREMLARHANIPIPYLEPFDQITNPGSTPF